MSGAAVVSDGSSQVFAWNRWSQGYSQQRNFFWPFSPTGTRTCAPHIRGSCRAVSEWQPAYPRQLIIQTDHILQLGSAVTDSLPRGSVVRPFQPYFPIRIPPGPGGDSNRETTLRQAGRRHMKPTMYRTWNRYLLILYTTSCIWSRVLKFM